MTPPCTRGWLMLVTDRHLVRAGAPARGGDAAAAGALVEVVGRAVAGGVDLVQVREKDLSDEALFLLARSIAEAVAGRARVTVNGRPGVARMAGVGLHLPEAMPYPAPAIGSPAPRPWLLWGRSVHDPQGAAAAALEKPDYLVAGPVFPSDSKPGAPALGLDGLRSIVAAAGAIPVLAIGGLEPARVDAVIKAGARGVAVRSAILRAPDPEAAAQAFRRALDGAAADASTKAVRRAEPRIPG